MDQLQDDFILEIFRLTLHDRNICNIVVGHVKENWLPQDKQKKFLTELILQAKVENKKPTIGTMKLAFRKNRDMMIYVDEVGNADIKDPDTILSTLEEFIRQAMFIQAYDVSAGQYNKGDKKAAYKTFSTLAEKMAAFSLTNDQFEPIFSNFNRRHIDRILQFQHHSNKLPTGIDELDYRTNGGPEVGEFWLLLGPAKSAKSQALISLGVNYARRGEKVMHIQAEGTRRQVVDRYDACWTGSKYNEIKNGDIDDEHLVKFENVIQNIGDGEIFVYTSEKFNSMNMLEVRQKAINLKRKYPDLRVILIDYLDLINPDFERYTLDNERHRQQKTAQAMKDLARELNVLVISATQASNIDRELLDDAEFVISEQNLAEDKGKVRPVDALITINRTSEERKKGECRLHLAAMREHDSIITIRICQNLSRVRFYDRKKTLNAGYFEN